MMRLGKEHGDVGGWVKAHHKDLAAYQALKPVVDLVSAVKKQGKATKVGPAQNMPDLRAVIRERLSVIRKIQEATP